MKKKFVIDKDIEVTVKKKFRYSFSNTEQRILKEKEKVKIKERFYKGLKEAGFIE